MKSFVIIESLKPFDAFESKQWLLQYYQYMKQDHNIEVALRGYNSIKSYLFNLKRISINV